MVSNACELLIFHEQCYAALWLMKRFTLALQVKSGVLQP